MICNLLIPGHISAYLTLPIFFILFRMGISAIMPMPKAAVHKYRNPQIRQHKVGFSINFVISPPASDFVFFKIRYQLFLC